MKPSKALSIPENAARILPVHRPLSTLVGRKQTVVRVQFSPQEPLGSCLWFTRTGVQHSPGSSAIEPPCAPAESGAYPPDRALPGSLRQCSLPLACRHLPKGTKLGLGRGAHLGAPSSANHTTAVVVVVVFFTLTDRASTIPSNIRGCQSGTWSQRGTKVNGSHHGDSPLLRPTGIQIATKGYATLQAMTPTNNKTVNQTSFTQYREQPRSTRIVVAYPRPAFSATNRTNTFQPVLINNSKFLKATHRTKIRKIEIPRSMVVEALSS